MRIQRYLVFLSILHCVFFVFTSFAHAQETVEDILRHVDVYLTDIEAETGDLITKDSLKNIKKIAALRKAFMDAMAKEEGLYLEKVRTRSLIEGLMTFYRYFEHKGDQPSAERVGEVIAKFLTMKNQIALHLNSLMQQSSLMRDESTRKFFETPKNIEKIMRGGDINYDAYFKMLEMLASNYIEGSETFENRIYKRAKEQRENFQTHEELWLEVIRSTDTVDGEYTKGLRELMRKGYFGKKEALIYLVRDSAGGQMVRSMVHFYFMRFFSEAYMSLYHWDGDRLSFYLKHVLTDPKMHAHFITFSIAAERARKYFKKSSAFQKMSLRHPLVARALIDAGPLFVGMITADAIFQMVEHPRIYEVYWLAKHGEFRDAAGLFIDLAGEVWFRKSFLTRALFSTAIFSGYNLAVYSALQFGDDIIMRLMHNRAVLRRPTGSPVTLFITFVSAFIVHDLLMEATQSTFTGWDWQARIDAAQEIARKEILAFNILTLCKAVPGVQKELNLPPITDPDTLIMHTFEGKFVPYLRAHYDLPKTQGIEIASLMKAAHNVELAIIGRAYEQKAVIERESEKLIQKYPKTYGLFLKIFRVVVAIELVNQAYEGYREFLFSDVHQPLFKALDEFKKGRKELLNPFYEKSRAAYLRGDSDAAAVILHQAQDREKAFRNYHLNVERARITESLRAMKIDSEAMQRLQQKIWIRTALYPEKSKDYGDFLDREPFDVGEEHWQILYTEQMHFFFTQQRGLKPSPLKKYLSENMIQKFILASLRKYRVKRGKESGLLGWVENQLEHSEKKDLYQTLEDLDPKLKSGVVRRIMGKR